VDDLEACRPLLFSIASRMLGGATSVLAVAAARALAM